MPKINKKRNVSTMTSVIVFASCLLAAVFVFCSSGAGNTADLVPTVIAHDQEHNGRRCSKRTVKGTYAFALQGNVNGVGPIAASGTTTFDGRGHVSLTGTINTTTLNPVVEGTFEGTYNVNSEDCTGTATFTTPGVFGFTDLHLKGVILNNGEEIRYLITDPGIVFAGSTARQFSKQNDD
jgi:hypothetical protein